MITVVAISSDVVIKPETEHIHNGRFAAPDVNENIVKGCPCDNGCVWRSRCMNGCKRFNMWVTRGVDSNGDIVDYKRKSREKAALIATSKGKGKSQ